MAQAQRNKPKRNRDFIIIIIEQRYFASLQKSQDILVRFMQRCIDILHNILVGSVLYSFYFFPFVTFSIVFSLFLTGFHNGDAVVESSLHPQTITTGRSVATSFLRRSHKKADVPSALQDPLSGLLVNSNNNSSTQDLSIIHILDCSRCSSQYF